MSQKKYETKNDWKRLLCAKLMKPEKQVNEKTKKLPPVKKVDTAHMLECINTVGFCERIFSQQQLSCTIIVVVGHKLAGLIVIAIFSVSWS